MENEEIILMEESAKAYNIRHRCFHFAKDVTAFINGCQYQTIHFLIFDQLLRSATSIGANVVEGGSGATKKDFINFFLHRFKISKQNKILVMLDTRYHGSG